MTDIGNEPAIDQLKRPDHATETVWTCGRCHSQVFFLHDDGHVECAACSHVPKAMRCGELQ